MPTWEKVWRRVLKNTRSPGLSSACCWTGTSWGERACSEAQLGHGAAGRQQALVGQEPSHRVVARCSGGSARGRRHAGLLGQRGVWQEMAAQQKNPGQEGLQGGAEPRSVPGRGGGGLEPPAGASGRERQGSQGWAARAAPSTSVSNG